MEYRYWIVQFYLNALLDKHCRTRVDCHWLSTGTCPGNQVAERRVTQADATRHFFFFVALNDLPAVL